MHIYTDTKHSVVLLTYQKYIHAYLHVCARFLYMHTYVCARAHTYIRVHTAAHERNELLEAALRAAEDNTRDAGSHVDRLEEELEALKQEIKDREKERLRQLKQINKLQQDLDDQKSSYAAIQLRANESERVLSTKKDKVY
jgi:septal ring factor EnvC (AmiA/AmiB activator)